MKGAKSTHTTEHTAVWLRFGGIENSGADKKNPECKRVPISPHPLQDLLLVDFWIAAILTGV